MKISAALAALLALGLVTIGGCAGDDAGGGDDTSTPVSTASAEEEAYFAELATVMEEMNGALSDINEALTQGFDPANPEDQRLAASQAYGRDYAEFNRARRDAIAGITAPESLAAAHEALLTAAEEGVALAESIGGELTSAPVPGSPELTALFLEYDGAVIVQRFRDACSTLQTRAARAGADADLGCNA